MADGRLRVSSQRPSRERDFGAVFPCQTFRLHEGPVWVVKFNAAGDLLASAGEDAVVRVWTVAKLAAPGPTTPTGRASAAFATAASAAAAHVLPRPPFLRDEPARQYAGHTSDVVDLAWSKANFLLSASMDKTVRLWHVQRGDCLCMFQHPDFVTSVDFHPTEDGYFVSGAFDRKLRIWSIPDGRVVQWQQAPVIITAVAFSPDGKMAVAGLFNGQCIFYLAEGLRYHTQIECRNRQGVNRKGRKVTGIQWVAQPGAAASSGAPAEGLLVTTNDSRLRVFDMSDFSQTVKFKSGMKNENMQIRSVLSEDGLHVLCGSEDGRVYVWPLRRDHAKSSSCESFEAHSTTATCAIFAPAAAAQLCRGDAVLATAANPCTRFLVTASLDGEICVFENVAQARSSQH